MKIPESPSEVNRADTAIAAALDLTELGIPVFAGRLDANGAPDRNDHRWRRWQAKKPDPAAVWGWRPGDALCAVTGVVIDVVDWDPRNDPDGRSFEKLSTDLGDDGPEVFWQVATPRGGRHLYVASLGLPKHGSFLPGLDYQGGAPDGTGRGFVFIPPTVRLGGEYRLTSAADALGRRCDALARYIAERAEARPGPASGGTGREEPSALKRAVLVAGAGRQRTELLRYVHEMERRGYERADITSLLKELMTGLSNFDGKDPWYPARGGDPERHIRGLFHRAGRIRADAAPGELDGIEEPLPADLVLPFSSVIMERTQYIVKGFLARGEMTVTDGEKGTAKSLIIEDTAARLSTGRPCLGLDECTGEKFKMIIFTAEASASKEIAPRLMAAGANMDMVVFPNPEKMRKLAKKTGLILPDLWPLFAKLIRAAEADVAVWDPINDFLAEDINTNNDASIRRALGPLGLLLQDANCAGWIIRHMNKDTGASARMRGSGSTAYQNRARIHTVTGRLPEVLPSGARFGITVVDSNLRKLDDVVMAYNVIDSEYPADDEDGMVPLLEWHGPCNITADDLVRGTFEKRKGPEPWSQMEIREVLEELFAAEDTTIPTSEVYAELKAAGFSNDKKTVKKVADELGIRSIGVGRKEGRGGIDHWEFTNVPVAKSSVRAHRGPRRAADS